MGTWRVRLEGPCRVFRDGEPFRPRTHHQSLLIAWLAARGKEGGLRSEAAALLWPDAERGHQAAYLRRAVMELRRAGLPIEGEGERIGVAPDALTVEPTTGGWIMEGVAHPIADEVRLILRRKPSPPSDWTVARADSERLLSWISDILIREHPEVALEMLARHGVPLMRETPPGPVLRLFLRALSAGTVPSRHRIAVTRHAASAAMYLTRYGLAERLSRQSVAESRAFGDEGLLAFCLSVLAFLLMERRRWDEALDTGQQASKAALRSGNALAITATHVSLGGVQWHLLQFDEAMRSYAVAYDAAEEEGLRQTVMGNARLVEGLYGVPLWRPMPPPDGTFSATGAQALAQANLTVGYGMSHELPALVAEGAAKLLRIAEGSGMDRFACLALDYAAHAFARLGCPIDAAACVRLGTRFRNAIGHRRSPAEKLAIRLHVPPPFFGPAVAARIAAFDSTHPGRSAERIAERLEVAAKGRN